jgi:hypothetical protein
MAHGGKRENAGRKPSTFKGVAKKLGKFQAEVLLSKINGNQRWIELATSDDENVSLKAMIYLTDRAYGKAIQPLNHSGTVTLEQLIASDAE